MKVMVLLFLATLALSSCMDKKAMVCNCCEIPYRSVITPMNCIDRFPVNETSSDERMLLLAFIDKPIAQDPPLSWNSINDPEFIKVAKLFNGCIK